MKTYSVMHNIGMVKYLVNFNDGIQVHNDGSPFFDIRTFKNKQKMGLFISKLKKDGYRYRQ